MEYLHLFETQVSHDSLYEGDNYKEPWIAYTLDNASVTFNKPHDYSKDYFTIEALEDGNVYFKYLSFAPTANQRYIEYSKDNGETWTRTTNVNNEEVIMTIPLFTGEKALVRGDNDAFGAYYEGADKFFGSCFYSKIKFNVSGNIMSLINGEKFISSTNVLEYNYTFLNLFYDSWGQHNDAPSHCKVVNVKNLILPATELTDYCYFNMFYGCTELTVAPALPATTLAPYCYPGMFYDCTALTTAPELPATTLTTECYSYMFYGCTALTTVPELPAITLTPSCYYRMFYGCTELTTVPSLPATTLAPYCYSNMFSGCTSLTTAPSLHATTLAEGCYSDMFSGCTALKHAPELQATILANGCYLGMFLGCTSLTTAPSLPATELADNCYDYMFNSCTALTTSPQLPAMTLAPSCYYGMFRGCTALTTSPKLPATTLAPRCYYNMFNGCTSLTTVPELSATTLAPSCYYYMFYGCTSLTTVPELSATTLATNCYYGMFRGCTSLNKSSELPAATLTTECYREMFYGCSKLNNITMLATDISATDCLTNWVNGVASTGTFVKAPAMTSLPTGTSGIPTGWTVIDDTEYLTLTALGNGTITITIPSCIDSTYATYISYSKNKLNWTETIIDNTEQTISIPVSSSDNVYLKGIAKAWYNADEEYGININSTANINASGNIMSLLYGDNFKDKTSFPEGSQYTFNELFKDNTHLISAENLILPATTLTNSCYSGMFQGCTSLTTAPELQATTLAYSCYSGMFYGCTSLTTAPELPATTLANYCYSHMFYGCASLTTAPELPATTLANYCYSHMLSDCTSLTAAPVLPATTLADNCYESMFSGCTSLTAAPVLPATTLTTYCYYNMFKGCTALTVAPTLPATTLASNCYRDMFNNCYSLTAAPELPATTLASNCYRDMFCGCTSLTTAPELPAPALINSCYYQMFYNCSNLNSIAMFATDISASNCLNNWVSGVAATGTFVKAPSMTSLPSGVSGIPTGWTVMDDTEYLTLTALGNGMITITIPAQVNSSVATSLSYSKNKSKWNETLIDDTEQTISIPVTSGENVYLKGIAKQLGNSRTGVNINSTANSTANINASGNIMSLLYGDNFKDKTSFPDGSKYTLRYLFKDNTHLINAENLILHATTLAEGCYYYMFYGCTSLTTAPSLPATTLSKNCYYYMFCNCSKLNNITMLATDISALSCLTNWVKGVSSTGTFTKAAEMTSLPTGTSGIPSGWTIVDK